MRTGVGSEPLREGRQFIFRAFDPPWPQSEKVKKQEEARPGVLCRLGRLAWKTSLDTGSVPLKLKNTDARTAGEDRLWTPTHGVLRPIHHQAIASRDHLAFQEPAKGLSNERDTLLALPAWPVASLEQVRGSRRRLATPSESPAAPPECGCCTSGLRPSSLHQPRPKTLSEL